MFNKFEIIGAGVSVLFMAMALYLVQVDNSLSEAARTTQLAQLTGSDQAGIVVVPGGADATAAREQALVAAVSDNGKLERMVIDDVKIGVGDAVQEGDVVSVHYVGTLENGQEFDNSRKRGASFEFKVGGGQVIAGWEKGLIGMKKGGQRMLVIPPEMAYGDQGIGPIPGGATLIFAIELVEIK